MKKRKNIKKTFAIVAIFLFIAPLFLTAYINVANYVESKYKVSENANPQSDQNNKSPEDNDEEKAN